MRPVEVDGSAEVRVRVQPFAAAPVSHVPDSHRLVVAGGQQVLASGVPRQPSNPVIVAEQREEALAGGHVPHLDGFVARPGGEEGSDDAGFAARVVVAAARLAGLRRSGLFDGWQGCLRCPGDALDNVVVFPQLDLALFGVDGPHADGLIVGAGCEQRTVDRQDSHVPHPLAVPGVSFDAESGDHLPHLDGLVTRSGQDVITGGNEADGTDVVVVTEQGLDTLVGGEVPQLDRHVGAAGGQELALVVESQVLHRIRVTLQGPLEVPGFEVPNFNGGVLGG